MLPRRAFRRVVFVSLLCSSALVASQAPPTSPFAPLAAGASWTYRLTFPRTTRIPLDVEWVGMEGIIGTSVTHGMREVKQGSEDVVLTLGEAESPSVVKATVTRDLGLLFFGPDITEYRLQLVPKGKATTMLSLYAKVAMKDPKAEPMVLAQALAAIPADGKSKVEEAGWVTGPDAGAVTVPAGTFKAPIHSRITKEAAGSYTVAHTIDAWLARGVGLVKLVAADSKGDGFYTLELVSTTAK